MASHSVLVKRVTFRAFDQTLTEVFVQITDYDIHMLLNEVCDTYKIISKEEGICTLEFQKIDLLIKLKKKSA